MIDEHFMEKWKKQASNGYAIISATLIQIAFLSSQRLYRYHDKKRKVAILIKTATQLTFQIQFTSVRQLNKTGMQKRRADEQMNGNDQPIMRFFHKKSIKN